MIVLIAGILLGIIVCTAVAVSCYRCIKYQSNISKDNGSISNYNVDHDNSDPNSKKKKINVGHITLGDNNSGEFLNGNGAVMFTPQFVPQDSEGAAANITRQQQMAWDAAKRDSELRSKNNNNKNQNKNIVNNNRNSNASHNGIELEIHQENEIGADILYHAVDQMKQDKQTEQFGDNNKKAEFINTDDIQDSSGENEDDDKPEIRYKLSTVTNATDATNEHDECDDMDRVNDDDELEMDGETIEGVPSINLSIWRVWTTSDVIKWFVRDLTNNGIHDSEIEKFINEFSQHNISGPVLEQLKNDQTLIEKLKQQFDNQSFGIWLTFETSLRGLS